MMADPRGRGFNRGKGKWHKPQAKTRLVSPADYGWKYQGEDDEGRVWWTRDNKKAAYIVDREGWAVVDADTGKGDFYPRWHIEEVTNDVFPSLFLDWLAGPIPFEDELQENEEITMADYYGVSR